MTDVLVQSPNAFLVIFTNNFCMKQIYVGTSGYQYKGWAEEFYPEHVKKKDWLQYYASQFNSVEINASFYRLPEANTFAKWRGETPAGFVFAIKGSRYVSHRRRLREPEEPVDRLFSRAVELRDKLGVVLWQFVERWPRDNERLERLDYFLKTISKHKVAKNIRQAFEFRHPTWFDEQTYEVLRNYEASLVVNQSSKWPVVEASTASWLYARFHGPKELYASAYSNDQLKNWAEKIKNLTNGDVFAYFNNDVHVDAPKNARTLAKYLSQ
jgi:uncharacterized protein YecE (DUF72 family)